MNYTVAITGMNARPDNPGPGYAVARCLQESSHFLGRVVGLGYDVLDAGLYHRHCQGSYLLPYPSAGDSALLERLLWIHEQEQLDAVIPCLDSELPAFLAIAPELEKRGIRSFLPDSAALQARNKDRLGQLCQQLGLAHPRTQAVQDPGFFQRCHLSGWQYPLVVKGAFYDAQVCQTPAEAELAFARLAQQWGYPVLAQQFLQGQEVNLTGLGDGQSLLGAVMMRKRALTDKGKAWAGVSIVDEQLERMASILVEGLRWRGPLEVEALKGHDGKLYLIEINPRFPAWIYLAPAVGRNLPAVLLDLMADLAPPSFPPLIPGRMFLRYAQEQIVDIQAFEALMMNGALVG